MSMDLVLKKQYFLDARTQTLELVFMLAVMTAIGNSLNFLTRLLKTITVTKLQINT